MLPLFGDTHVMGVVLDEDDEVKLDLLNEALLASRLSGATSIT